MSRYFSFAVLLAVIVLLIIMFYKLMVGFFIPLFLAALLVVIFQPLHDWILRWCGGRSQLAASLTTTAACLIVFVPLALVSMLAASEGRAMLQRLTSGAIVNQLIEFRRNLGLDIAAVDELRNMENEFQQLLALPNPAENRPAVLKSLARVELAAEQFRERVSLPDANQPPPAAETGTVSSVIRLLRSETPERAWQQFQQSLNQIRQAAAAPERKDDTGRTSSAPLPANSAESPAADAQDSNPGGEIQKLPANGSSATEVDGDSEEVLTIDAALQQGLRYLEGFKISHCGGKTWSWLKLASNPTNEELSDWGQRASVFLREQLPAIGGATTAALASFAFGIVIMVVALYFFLADGAAMLSALKHLSPLDEENDNRLIAEFSTVSRAVVLATLLSALAQGLAAGIGFWACGIEQVFLLTILTAGLALVPFVGAAAIWLPVCLWLYAIEDRMGAAIGLAVYGALVVSMIDNLIKPFVLHGQSNLHPLLALLSVLGGVTAIGPIGILIGPMIVAFLQTTLEILRREIGELDLRPPVLELAANAGQAAGLPELTATADPSAANETAAPAPLRSQGKSSVANVPVNSKNRKRKK